MSGPVPQVRPQGQPDTVSVPAITREARPTSEPEGARILFRGPIHNETLNQGGQVTLLIRRRDPPGTVTARFEASAGLIGAGELTGVLSESGRLALSGQLMMGRNPFDCDLTGVVSGGRLTGTANFARPGGRSASHGSFSLTRM